MLLSRQVAGVSLFPRAKIYLPKKEEQMINGQTPRFLFVKNKLEVPYEILEDNQNLDVFGLKIRTISTPGHTPGSMVVLMEEGEMLTGDSLFGLAGKRIFPPFAEDPAALMESWKLISNMDVRRFFPAHGASISPERFLDEFMALDS